MTAIDLTTDIEAPPERVWRALCNPAEVVLWDSSVTGALDAPPDYPQPGQRVTWRAGSGPFRTLIDSPLEVVPPSRLRSLLELGPYRIDETYSLTAIPAGTQLDLALSLDVRVPLLGRLIERLQAAAYIRGGFHASLEGLKAYCEATPGA